MKICGRGVICLALPVLLEGTGEFQFELWPCFVWGRAALPNAIVFDEDDRLEDQLIRSVEDLKRSVRGTACVGKIYGVLDLTK